MRAGLWNRDWSRADCADCLPAAVLLLLRYCLCCLLLTPTLRLQLLEVQRRSSSLSGTLPYLRWNDRWSRCDTSMPENLFHHALLERLAAVVVHELNVVENVFQVGRPEPP